MRVFRGVAEAVGAMGPSAVSIGNFDGVHRGHQELFRRLVANAARLGLKASVITFDPHPTKIVAPHRAPRLLSGLDRRLEWIAESGIEQALVIPFDEEFSQLPPEEFVRWVLVEGAGARLVLVGENFRFGNRQVGDTEQLAELGARWGFETDIVQAVEYRRRMVSSTAVRGLLDAGEVLWAGRMLGRWYTLEGEVIAGQGIGSKQTVPTLNLKTAAEVLPAQGVYVTSTVDAQDGRQWPSVTNIGMRPTFGGDSLTVETYLLRPLEGTTPSRIGVSFLRRLREERKFADAGALKAQILRDVWKAEAYFRRRTRWGHGKV
ncbi:MAG: bifunctional riboflavin kinase/FAD synthetase [Bryobacterales bacterium]|nr:bifunctional riboflavin kinase/FAD synthetase [Bryobacterales bacterium]